MLDNRKELFYLKLAYDQNLINMFSYIEYSNMLTIINERNLILCRKLKTEIRSKYKNIIPSYKPVLLSEISKNLALYKYKILAIKNPVNISFQTFGMYTNLFK